MAVSIHIKHATAVTRVKKRVCPNCERETVGKSSQPAVLRRGMYEHYEREHLCMFCGVEWTEVFTLTSVRLKT